MRVVLSLVVAGDPDLLDAQIAYHLNAGVDLVLVTERSPGEEARGILDSYERDGVVRRMAAADGDDAASRTAMARFAASELAADWLVDSGPTEFWLPRGESLEDVLLAIPPRYGLVQALVRDFLPSPEDGRPFFERMTVRRAVGAEGSESGPLEAVLRPLYRARADVVIGVDREAALDGRVPLRAWYPVEVLRFPLGSSDEGGLLTDEQAETALQAGTLVRDERLREALGRLQAAGEARRSPGGYALPEEGVNRLGLRTPTVVDDVGYAVECAALKEVDFEPLLARIAELEQRIGTLEARFWPRVRRAVSRTLRR